MSNYINKYCRVEWTIDNFTLESLATTGSLKSDHFLIKFANEKLEWNIELGKGDFTDAAHDSDDGDTDIEVREAQELLKSLESTDHRTASDDDENDSVKSVEGTNFFKLILNLKSPPIEDIPAFENKDPLVVFRCYVMNEIEKEKFMFIKKFQLAKFTRYTSFGTSLNMNYIFEPTRKLINEKSITFVVLISLHNRNQQEISSNSYPNEFFFKNNLYSDFTIVCNDRKIPVHRNILHSASPVFAAMFQSQMSEAENSQVKIDDIVGNVVLEVMRFIYTGKVKNFRGKAMELLNAADKYHLFELKRKCVESLSLHLSVKNVFKCLILADRHDEEILLRNCLGFIKMNHKKLVNSNEWANIDGNILARAIASSVGDFLQQYKFRDTLISDSDFDSHSASTMDLDESFIDPEF